MKKNIEIPMVMFDRFENEDIIVTSDPIVDPSSQNTGGNLIQSRESIWD